jgi:hypothetical protein
MILATVPTRPHKRSERTPGIVNVALSAVRPSRENDAIYHRFNPDDPTDAGFLASVRASGVLQPIEITGDNWIVSGHRRYAAALAAGLAVIPCRRLPIRRADERVREELVSADAGDADALADRANTEHAAALASAEALAEALKPKAKEIKIAAGKATGRGHKKVRSKLTEPLNVRDQAAKEAGVSAGSMSAYRIVRENELHGKLPGVSDGMSGNARPPTPAGGGGGPTAQNEIGLGGRRCPPKVFTGIFLGNFYGTTAI